MLLAALIFAGLPLVTLRNDHVTVDLFDPVVPDWLFRIQHIVACAIGFVATAYLAWRLWLRAVSMDNAGETTAQLKFKLAYLTYGMSILMALTAIALLLLVFRQPDPPLSIAGLAHDRGADRFCGLSGARFPARADGIRHGNRRLRRRRLQAQLQRRRRDDRAGHLRDRPFLHAVGHPALHPDGQFRRAREDIGRALPRRLLLPRPSARRACHVHDRGERRLRRHLRLIDRDRGHVRQGRLSVDAQIRLQGHARRRLDRGRRHARHPDPALGHHGDLRDHDRDPHRQAVRRRHHPGTGRDRSALRRRELDHLARSEGRPPGRAASLAGAPRTR